MSDRDLALQARGLLATLIDDFDAVKVEIEGGVAYLEGIAESIAARDRIEQLVLRVPGIRQVVNCLAVEHVATLEHGCELAVFPEQEIYLLPARDVYAPIEQS